MLFCTTFPISDDDNDDDDDDDDDDELVFCGLVDRQKALSFIFLTGTIVGDPHHR